MTAVLEEPQVEEIAPPVPPPPERLAALDVFRGATIAGMLLVNNPGTWSAIYPPLEHAPWNGWTPTDLIFPFFLFIVGITTALSLQKRPPQEVVGKIVRRGLMIVLVGLLLNAFPFFWWGKIAGVAAKSNRFLSGVIGGKITGWPEQPLDGCARRLAIALG